MNVAALFRPWTAVSLRPSVATFQEELVRRSDLRTWLGVAAGTLIGLGLSWLVHLASGRPPEAFMGLASMWVSAGTPPPFSSWWVIVAGGTILGFFNFQIVLFIFARLLGGKGSFAAQAYVQSLFYAPLAVVQQVLAAVPTLGPPLFFLVAAWSLVPTTTSLQAAHGYTKLRAVITWLLPIVLNVVVVALIVMLLTARAAR